MFTSTRLTQTNPVRSQLPLATLQTLRKVAAEHMLDNCELLRRDVDRYDEYNKPIQGWTSIGESWCGLLHPGAMAESTEGAQQPLYTSSLRLPCDIDLLPTDRIRVTARSGEDLERPLLFEIIGDVVHGPTATTCDLRLVTTYEQQAP